jgi:hypothetical protein
MNRTFSRIACHIARGQWHLLVLAVLVATRLAYLPPADAAPQTSPDPCKMLTQAQLAEATGAEIGAGQSIGTTCSWSGKPKVIVSLWYPTPAIWEGLLHPSPQVTKTAGSGLGDMAFFNTMANLTSLGVKKGNTNFVIKVYGISEPSKQMSIEKALAENVLAKM